VKLLIAVFAALLLAGCSKTSQNASSSEAKTTGSSAPANPTDAQMRAAGLKDEDIDNLKVVNGEKWKRIDKVDPMDGAKKEVDFAYFGQPIGDAQKKYQPALIVSCGSKLVIFAQTGPVDSGKVRLKFGDGPVQSQDWLNGHTVLFAGDAARPLLKQALASPTFKFEFTPADAGPQAFEIRTLNLKELLDSEPLCKNQ
jgi:hypothetical protein